MGRVAEALLDELEEVATLTREPPEDVHKEWKSAEQEGLSFGAFVVRKSRKKTKK